MARHRRAEVTGTLAGRTSPRPPTLIAVHRAECSAHVRYRGSQPSRARRMSSWCTKTLQVFTTSWQRQSPAVRAPCGPAWPGHGKSLRQRLVHRPLGLPGDEATWIPAAPSGLRSRTSRCASRSRTVQSPHRVGDPDPPRARRHRAVAARGGPGIVDRARAPTLGAAHRRKISWWLGIRSSGVLPNLHPA